MTNEFDNTPRVLFVDGLRELARLFETKPEIPLPSWQQDITLFVRDESAKEDLAAVARAIGSADKSYSDDLFELQKSFGGLLRLRVCAYRQQVCERVVIGTKIEPAHEIPAQEAKTVAAREVEVVEWRCTPLLSGGRADVEMPASQLELVSSSSSSQAALGAGDDFLDDSEIPF